MLEHQAAYCPVEGGWCLVKVLDFPGTISQGRTVSSARRMIREALRLMAECLLERGEPLPRPNPRARDKKATLVEPIRLGLRVRSAAS